jgi:hypothetical protein
VAMARAGRPALLAIVAREYRGRRRAVRALTRLCAGRPAAHLAVMLLGLLARAVTVVPAEPVGNVACSLIFNLLYYDGLVNALGSRAAFAALLRGQE